MTLFLILAVLLPWSLWRQMHEHEITREGLVKLPLIFAAVGLAGLYGSDIPTGRAAAAYAGVSLALSLALGVWRGAVIPAWRTPAGACMTRGNRTTIMLLALLIGLKVAMGTAASLGHWDVPTAAGEVFVFLGLSFAAQNVVVARRTLSVGAAGSTPSRRSRSAPAARRS